MLSVREFWLKDNSGGKCLMLNPLQFAGQARFTQLFGVMQLALFLGQRQHDSDDAIFGSDFFQRDHSDGRRIA